MSKSIVEITDNVMVRSATLFRLSSRDPKNKGGMFVSARTRRRAEQSRLKRLHKKNKETA